MRVAWECARVIEGDPRRLASDLELARELLEAGHTLQAAVLCSAIGQRYRYDTLCPWDSAGGAIKGDPMLLGASMLRATRAALLGDRETALRALGVARELCGVGLRLRVIDGGGQPSARTKRARLRLA